MPIKTQKTERWLRKNQHELEGTTESKITGEYLEEAVYNPTDVGEGKLERREQ